MARPREFDEAKVIEAIKAVFWEKGYDGTSYPDLIAATGLHKGSLYQAFGDKRALYLRALAAYKEQEVASAVELLSNPAHGHGKARIATLLNFVIEAVSELADRRGCLLCNAAVEQAPFDPQTEKSVKQGLDQMQQAFESALAQFPDKTKIAPIASQAMAVYFGMRVMAKAGVAHEMLEQARDGLLHQLNDIQ